jgi:CheY-like chemotaxis protein
MSPNPDLPTTRVLFIDGDANDRALYASGLRDCSPDYQIIETPNGQSGLASYRAQRFDCVILELDLPDLSGFEVLADLVPHVRRPNIAVIVLTRLTHRGLYALARENGAYACFYKPHTSSDDLDRAINRAIGFVGQIPKEDRRRTV